MIRQHSWRRITTRVFAAAGMASLALLAAAVSAHGEARYTAVQCYPGVGGQSQPAAAYTETGPAGHDAVCQGDGLGIYFPGRTPNGRTGQWTISAPAGAYFSYVSLLSRRNAAKGWRPRTVAIGTDGATTYIPGVSDGQWHPGWTLGSFKAVASRLVCRGASHARPQRKGAAKPCLGSWGAYVFARQFEFTLRDPTPPVVSRLGGSLLSSGNRSGVQSVTATASDEGGGIRQLFLRVNGTRTAIKTYPCDLVRVGGKMVAGGLTPCPASRSDVLSVNTAAAPFRNGFNSVQVCAADYSDATDPNFGANVTCSSARQVSIGSAGTIPGSVPRPTPPPPPPVVPPLSGCPLSQTGSTVQMAMPGCQQVASDTGANDPRGFWGNIECGGNLGSPDPGRASVLGAGGDPHVTATGASQGNDSFRRLTVFDGDDYWGERCELGRNDTSGPTAFYREGQRRATFISLRLPSNLPVDANAWQTIVQMKQAQPYIDAVPAGVATEFQVYNGRVRLNTFWTERWSFAAQTNTWLRIAVDGYYTQNPGLGWLQASVDLNRDGDFSDGAERSPVLRGQTLAREPTSGRTIPSHLRAGIYHNPSIACPAPSGCSTEVDNVQVLKAPGAP